MKILFLIASFAAELLGQPTWTSVSSDWNSHTLMRVRGTASVSIGYARVEFGLTATPPLTWSTEFEVADVTTEWDFLVSGLAPGTLYYWRWCGKVGSGDTEGCSAVQNTTTDAEPAGRFNLPRYPVTKTAIPTEPATYGHTYTVGTDCTVLQDCVTTASAIADSSDIKIVVPLGTYTPARTDWPARACSTCGWIVTKTAAADALLPPPGSRITPDYLPYLPVLVGPKSDSNPNMAVFTNWTGLPKKLMFIGLAFDVQSGGSQRLVSLITFNRDVAGNGVSDIVFDRCYFNVTTTVTRLLNLPVDRPVIVNSYLRLEKSDGYMNVAVDFTNSTGARIENNDILAPGISAFVEGGDETWPLTQDSYLRRNYFHWNPALKEVCTGGMCRQFLEYKQAQRSLVSGNVMDGWWDGGGVGTFPGAIILTTRTSDNGNVGVQPPHGDPSLISDVTLQYNTVRTGPGFLGNTWGQNNVPLEGKGLRRLDVHDNLIYDIRRIYSTCCGYGSGQFVNLYGGVEDVVAHNNTMWAPQGAWPAISMFLNSRSAGFRSYGNLYGFSIAWGTLGGFQAKSASGLTGRVPAFPDYLSATAATQFAAAFTAMPSADAQSWYQDDTMVPGVTADELPAAWSDPKAQLTPAVCATYWTGFSRITCAGTGSTANAVLASIGMVDPTNFDLTWKYNSAYQFNGLGPVGANIYALSVEQGWVYGPHLLNYVGGHATTLAYETRDTSMQCYVSYGGGAWVADTPGSRFRTLSVPGGSSTYRFICAGGVVPLTGTVLAVSGTL